MLRVFLAASLVISIAYGWEDCVSRAVSINAAINKAVEHTGKVYSVKLYKKKKTGECLYSVRGTKGFATVDALTGEVIRFNQEEKVNIIYPVSRSGGTGRRG